MRVAITNPLVNLATRYKACQLLASRLGQSVQDDNEHGQRAHTRANNVAAVGCAYAYAGLGELLDCQTIMVMDYWASRLLDYKSYIGHGCYLLQAVCEALQDVVDIWTSKYWDVPLTKDFLIGLF